MLYVKFPEWIHPEIFFWWSGKEGLLGFLGNIRWYGMMYIVAFSIAYGLFKLQNKRAEIKLTETHSSGVFFACIIGLLLGARLFSVIIYEGSTYYLTRPWLIFWPFRDGKLVGLQGMSFHGGVVGGALGFLYYCWRNKLKFRRIVDMACAGIPLGYTFGRLGNFINAELWGKVSRTGFGMVFPGASTDAYQPWAKELAAKFNIESVYHYGREVFFLPRHPSQLYEAFFEGIFLWLILWFIVKRFKKFDGAVASMYVALYGVIRFVIEYYREPDEGLGYIIKFFPSKDNPALLESFLNFSMGQILCFLMVVAGVVLYFIFKYMDKRDRLKGLDVASVYLPGADTTEKPKKPTLTQKLLEVVKESSNNSKSEPKKKSNKKK
ncbi:MAG: prolipoprotein diacylglyceryl transferase [Spirochaetales bacterium]|nr:prolipoprotein diacylglyceryl transferase [Spirochaetales bacterium]